MMCIKQQLSQFLSCMLITVLSLFVATSNTSAQDYDSLLKRLKAAMDAGEVTGQQVEIMMQALRKSTASKESKKLSGLQQQALEIKKAIESGSITKEEGLKKIAALKKPASNNSKAPQKIASNRYETAVKEIRAGVEVGKITEEQAKQKLAGLKQFSGNKAQQQKYNAAEAATAKVREALRNGSITEAEAKKKISEIRLSLSNSNTESPASKSPNLDAIEKRLAEGVAAGKITKEQAAALLERYQQRLQGGQNKARPSASNRPSPEAYQKRLAEAVKAGRITEQQAEQMLNRYKERALKAQQNSDNSGNKEKRPAPSLEAIEHRLEEAVKSGKITEQQAKQTLERYRQRLNQQK
ncbi:MAG: hypothetical protein ACJZ8O_00070 [Pirellulaceae bacterium]